ncbi:MAG: Ldh family oxidoreductase [Alphaproteobacteria bacterium]|nr:Ldh family oxidoreductase [Alphaproteobacteria bacterium]
MAAANVSGDNAAAIARALVQAEIDGQKGHGLSRIESYAAQARTGKADGHARPLLNKTRPAALMIDVANGFAYRALELATQELPNMSAETGIAAAGLVRSHHAGALGQVGERLADSGMVAMIFANTPHAMTAWGGSRPLFGTNPIAFAAPRRERPPVVVDLALSEIARGKILAAAQRNEPIPTGWANDASGNPTTNANAALKGTLLPAGGAKGAALAFMVEVLAASLIGANQSFEASSFFDADGPPPAVGQFIVAIDPAAFAGTDHFADKLELLATAIEADDGARLPGSRKAELRQAATRNGVPVIDDLLARLKAAPSVSNPQ